MRNLAAEAASRTNRVLVSPRPVCHVTGFGDSAVDMLLRFWIDDPTNGVTNIKGEVLLALWDSLNEHGIEIPMPQREVRVRELASPTMTRAREAQSAQD